MLKKILIISVLIFIGVAVSFAQLKKAKTRVDGEKLIADMARSRNMPPVVGDDGVFSNTLLEGDAVPPEVRRILGLKQNSIPLLIAHLDDTRPTRMMYCCGDKLVLTVGDACLNMLSMIAEPTAPMFDKECLAEADNQSFCLNENYVFSMSSYVRSGKRRLPSAEVKRAKRYWLKAYRENRIQFKGY